MSHLLTRRSLYGLALCGVLGGALVACSMPPQQPDGVAPGPSSGAPPPPAPPGTAQTAGTAGTAAAAGAAAHPDPADAAAQARVQAAREQAMKAQAQANQAAAAQCQDIATQIRTEQTTERAAPSTSIDEDIVAATLAKADKRIDRLQQQYDSLGCPDSDLPATRARVPQLPPAPGALPP